MKFGKYIQALLMIASASFISSCDDGNIYPASGKDSGGKGLSVVMKGNITGNDAFYGTDYTLALAAFSEDNDFAVITKGVGQGEMEVTLSNIPAEAISVELCVINRLRERIFTLASLPLEDNTKETVSFDVGEIDASPYNVIATGVFAVSCSQCHGATGHAAAGLDLHPEEAYRMLVIVPSVIVEGEMRVKPGDASHSTLWQALATNISDSWAFSHSNLLTFEKTDFIETWINQGIPQ
ncbi:MAG: hypothetical protein K2K58_07785 [Muribaculaceae bacterium]|nr:hypothetical protein [Muribaculaceae bacterium]